MTDEPPSGGTNAGQGQAKPPCAAHAKDGQPCRAFALPGGTFCHWHEPTRAERQREASAKGGRMTAIRSRRPRLNTAGQLMRFNGALLHAVLEGKAEPDVGRAVFYGLSVQVRLIEFTTTTEIEKRLAALETALAAQQQPTKVRAWGG